MSSYRDFLYGELLGGSSSSGGAGIMEDVIISQDEETNTWNINAQGGKRYLLVDNPYDIVVNEVEDSPLESEIWFTLDSGAPVMVFPETLNWIGEPSFEAGKSYIINIRNNCAVCAAYTPGVE